MITTMFHQAPIAIGVGQNATMVTAVTPSLVFAHVDLAFHELVERIKEFCSRTRTCTGCLGIAELDSFDKKGTDAKGNVIHNSRCKLCISADKQASYQKKKLAARVKSKDHASELASAAAGTLARTAVENFSAIIATAMKELIHAGKL